MCHADTQDVIVTSSPFVSKPSVDLTITIPVSSAKLSDTHAISTGSSAEKSGPSRMHQKESFKLTSKAQ